MAWSMTWINEVIMITEKTSTPSGSSLGCWLEPSRLHSGVAEAGTHLRRPTG